MTGESAPIALREPELRLLGDAIPHMLWTTTAEGRCTYLNARWLDYSGRPLEALLGDGWLACVHPDDRDATVAAWQRATTRAEPYDVEFRIRRRDGEYRRFLTRGVPIVEDGRIVRWIGTNTDIEDIRRIGEALAQREREATVVADVVPTIIWTADAAGEVLSVNDRWRQLIGRTDDASLGDAWRAALHPEDTDAIERFVAGIAAGVAFSNENRLRLADGTYRWFRTVAQPLRDADGTLVRWIGSTHDIHEERTVQELLAERLQRERIVADAFQSAALPPAPPAIAGFRFSAAYRPASDEARIGGDWYDAFALDDGRAVVSIGDAAGHGLDAAVIMAGLRQSIRAAARLTDDPVKMLAAAHHVLVEQWPGTFATAFVGVIDANARAIVYANAGDVHPIVENGRTVELETTQPPLGIAADADPGPSLRTTIPPDGWLVLYTDGLVEATRDIDEGVARLIALLSERSLREDPQAAQRVIERLGSTWDDVAALFVQIDDPKREHASYAEGAGRRVGLSP